MSVGIALLLIIAMLSMVGYLSWPPQYANKKLVDSFNKMTCGFTVILSLVVYFIGKSNMLFSANLKEIMSIFFAILAELFLLVLFFIARNFWLFRPPRRPGGF